MTNQKTKDDTLVEACRLGYLEAVRFMVGDGADVHVKCDQPLINAAQNGHVEVVEFLLNNGADINAQGSVALIDAASSGQVGVVKLLMKRSSSIRSYQDHLEQALYWAEKKDQWDVVNYIESVLDEEAKA